MVVISEELAAMMKGQQSANSNNNGLYQENRSVTGGEEYRLFSQHRGADYRSRLTEAEAPWQEGAVSYTIVFFARRSKLQKL